MKTLLLERVGRCWVASPDGSAVALAFGMMGTEAQFNSGYITGWGVFRSDDLRADRVSKRPPVAWPGPVELYRPDVVCFQMDYWGGDDSIIGARVPVSVILSSEVERLMAPLEDAERTIKVHVRDEGGQVKICLTGGRAGIAIDPVATLAAWTAQPEGASASEIMTMAARERWVL